LGLFWWQFWGRYRWGKTVCWCSLEENTSLPEGGSEAGTWFYARARLGIATLGLYCWGGTGTAFEGKGEYFTYVGRVLEKSVEYVEAIWLDMLHRINLKGVKFLEVWSDAAGCFRCHKLLGMAGFFVPEEYRLSVSLNWFCEGHGKGKVDGWLATLNRRKRAMAQREPITTIAGLITAWKTAEAGVDVLGDRPAETFIDFMPPMKTAIKCNRFRPATLPVMVTAAYAYTFVINDDRRKSFRGRFPHQDTITGVSTRGWPLTNLSTKAEVSVFVTLLSEKEKAAVAADEDGLVEDVDGEPIGCSDKLPLNTKVHDGWRCSYVAECIIEHDSRVVPIRVLKKAQKLSHVIGKLPPSRRHRSADEASATQRKLNAAQGLRAKAVRAAEKAIKVSEASSAC
jgi:hypothetical protein